MFSTGIAHDKENQNGLPNPHMGAYLGFPQASACLAFSSVGVEASLFPERTSQFGKAHSMCAEPKAMKATIRKPDQ